VLIDEATLRDLDVLTASTPRGRTLWSLVDRTRSRAGREHLRHSLTAPDHAAAGIMPRQRAHQALARDLDGYGRLLDAFGAHDVERYLGATWQLPSAQPAIASLGVWRPAWFKEYLCAIDEGRTCVLTALTAAAALRDRLAAVDAELLRAVADSLTAALAAPQIGELRALAHRRGVTARIAFDGVARDTGRPALAAMLEAIGIVDAMWSLAAVTAERGWTYPRPSSRLAAEGLYNPFMESGQGVANDLRLDDRTRVCIVTGPNMAGKSTFLRAIAVAVLLAHAGCGVPAASMEFPAVATIFSSVQITDDLGAGESFYLAEVRRIGALATALHEHRTMLAVLDEPFRGTNVHDATEASLGVISRLVAHPGALVFVATHLAEVATALRDDPRVQFLCFSADLAGDRPVFDYRLRDGVSTQRLGMTLLRQERILELLEPRADAAITAASGVTTSARS
jgi:DNA mismatch repair ATPase MutS